MSVHIVIVGHHGVARDSYCQLSLSLSLFISLSIYFSLSVFLSLSFSLYLSHSISLSPYASLENACSSKIGDIMLAAAAPSLVTTHLLYRRYIV
jgi:hypothetical protein